MNKLDKQYQDLLQTILDYGVEKSDRTGTGTKSIFGYTIRHKMSDGFPLLTTKKMAFQTMVTELIWFLRGDTNIKYLVDNNCNIWNGDAYKNYYNSFTGYEDIPTQEWFINEIKTNSEFANKWGELGPIYGAQWRDWTYIDSYSYHRTFDQIQNLINELKTNPDSRRLMVNSWNVGELDQMVLPPCHYGFQVYTREENGQRYISLMWNQRSVDTFLGLPFNIASYGLLLEIIAKEPTLNTMATRRLTAARRGPNIAPYTARMRPDLKKRKKDPLSRALLHNTDFYHTRKLCSCFFGFYHFWTTALNFYTTCTF
jgi:thymidylate synthase